MCNFEDCWGWQEPCCGTSAYSGVIAFDYTANEYFLTITLSNTDTLQIAATQSQLPLYVDEDIIEDSIDEEWDFVNIEAGEYPFLSSIGSYGGYKLPVIFY